MERNGILETDRLIMVSLLFLGQGNKGKIVCSRSKVLIAQQCQIGTRLRFNAV